MIKLNFKPCCQDCGVINVEVQTVTDNIGDRQVKIRCVHDVVCGRYNESEVEKNELEKDCTNCFYEDISSEALPCKNCSKCYVVSENMKSKWKMKEVENEQF